MPQIDFEPSDDRHLTVLEALCLAAMLVIGVLSLASLAMAYLHHHDPVPVWSATLVLLAVCVAIVWRWDRPAIRFDLADLVPGLVGAAIAVVTMLPGFEYATGDRDPGVYVQHAVAIQRTDSIDFPLDALQAGLPALNAPGSVWPGLWIEPGKTDHIFPQFYHLWPSLLASAKDAGGYTGLFDTGPLLGILSVLLAVCVGRRIAGWPGAWTAALLLSTNMLEVWQSKYPSSEIFSQSLFLAATLGVVIAIQTGSRATAGIAGLLAGLIYLERPDGILVVLMGWSLLCALLAFRRFDARAAWFGVGLLLMLPAGFCQAYGSAKKYTVANNVPSLQKVLAGMVLLGLIAVALAVWRRPIDWVVSFASRTRTQLRLGLAFFLLCVVLFVVGALRPRLFGMDYTAYGARTIRSFDEISLIRLSWFFTWPGLGVLLLGIAFAAMTRWRLDRWVVAGPAVALMALYCYHVKNSPYLMWATRRFIPTVVPGMVWLIGLGFAGAVLVLLQRRMPRPVTVGIVALPLAVLTALNLAESWPLRHDNENGKSVEVVTQMASLAGSERGVFVWQAPTSCCAAPAQLFGGPLLTIANQTSVTAPASATLQAGFARQYLDFGTKAGRPVFYVMQGKAAPPAVSGVTATPVREFAGSLNHWEETYVTRPKKRKDYVYHFTVYRLTTS